MINNEAVNVLLRRRVSRELFMKFMYQNMLLEESYEDLYSKLNKFVGDMEDDIMDIYKSYNGRDLDVMETYRDVAIDGPYLINIANAVENNLSKIDDEINTYAKNWSTSTMPVIDVSLMRVAIAEMLYLNDIPVYASCSEAVELAKKYCDDDSYKYINGILGSVTSDVDDEKKNM